MDIYHKFTRYLNSNINGATFPSQMRGIFISHNNGNLVCDLYTFTPSGTTQSNTINTVAGTHFFPFRLSGISASAASSAQYIVAY